MILLACGEGFQQHFTIMKDETVEWLTRMTVSKSKYLHQGPCLLLYSLIDTRDLKTSDYFHKVYVYISWEIDEKVKK